MAILERALITQNSPVTIQSARARRWNVAEYYRMAEAGILGPDERTELIEGDVYTMAPNGVPHRATLARLHRELQNAFGESHYVETQSPSSLSETSEPEPDAYVALGQMEDYDDHHPRPNELLLVVEVSDSSLAFDRTRKSKLYADSGIPEYWIVNIVDRKLETFLDPVAGSGYRATRIYSESEVVAPLHAPDAGIPVVRLLPKQDTTQI